MLSDTLGCVRALISAVATICIFSEFLEKIRTCLLTAG